MTKIMHMRMLVMVSILICGICLNVMIVAILLIKCMVMTLMLVTIC